jgi:hypothetical protein
MAGVAGAQSAKVYTLDADFDVLNAVKLNVDHAPATTISNGLELTAVGSTFPVLWIANAAEDTVSKIDTSTGTEVARYRTWFGPAATSLAGIGGSHRGNAFAGAAPSRTAVDTNGNAFVLNRHFDTRKPTLWKIMNSGGTPATTSQGPTDVKAVTELNGNGTVDFPAEVSDSRIGWVAQVGDVNGLGRSLCIGPDGHLWVGMYNTSRYYKISSVDGSTLAGPITVSWNPYGCLIDANGTLWSSSLGSVIGRITNTNQNNVASMVATSHLTPNCTTYGIALGNGKVYVACISGGGYRAYDPATNTFASVGGADSTGISVDGSGNIWLSQYVNGGVRKYRPDNSLDCIGAVGAAGENRGVIIDNNNDAWQVGKTADQIKRFRGSDCAAQNTIPVGDEPYTYSDASGFAALNQTNQTGTWTVIQDAGVGNAYWGTIGWNTAPLPPGATVEVKAQASDNVGDLSGPPATPVTNGANFTQFGRFIKVEARLTANVQRQSPQLLDISIATRVCDVDRDGDIDRNDLNAIAAAAKINLSVGPADPRDADRNGVVSVLDVRACTLRCTRPNCAVN